MWDFLALTLLVGTFLCGQVIIIMAHLPDSVVNEVMK